MQPSLPPTPTTPAELQALLSQTSKESAEYLGALRALVTRNQRRLRKLMGTVRLCSIQNVLDNPQGHDPAELEAWAKATWMGIFGQAQ